MEREIKIIQKLILSGNHPYCIQMK
jgi:hypothetical protein